MHFLLVTVIGCKIIPLVRSTVNLTTGMHCISVYEDLRTHFQNGTKKPEDWPKKRHKYF